MNKTITLLLVFAFVGCTLAKRSVQEEIGAFQADPQKVPKQIKLYKPVPIFVARFEASDAGYTLKAFRSMGTLSINIDQNRDVIIKAIDQQGNLLSSVSIDNPRDVHTVGTRKPAKAVLSKATFTVFFPNPDTIRALEVNVLKGANAGFKKSFTIDPKELPKLNKKP